MKTTRTRSPATPTLDGRHFVAALFMLWAFLMLSSLLGDAGTWIHGLEHSRRARCQRMRAAVTGSARVRTEIRKQLSWMEGPRPVEVRREVARDVDAVPVTRPVPRRVLSGLVRKGLLKGVPVCPEQGPLYTAEHWHFTAAQASDGHLVLRCRVHGL